MKYHILINSMVSLLLFTFCENEYLLVPEEGTWLSQLNSSQEIAALGWSEFQNSNYSEAILYFQAAIAKSDSTPAAYGGLGWCYMKLDSIALAEKSFTIGINLFSESNLDYKDACAGRSFIYLAQDKFQSALDDVSRVLNDHYTSSSRYIFRYDENINEQDLLLTRAECYFMQTDYPHCYSTLLNIDSTLQIDEDDPESLARAIDTLKSLII